MRNLISSICEPYREWPHRILPRRATATGAALALAGGVLSTVAFADPAAAARDSCSAIDVAAHQLADGHKYPKTGNCTALSTTLLVNAVGAFIIHPTPGAVKEAKADVR